MRIGNELKRLEQLRRMKTQLKLMENEGLRDFQKIRTNKKPCQVQSEGKELERNNLETRKKFRKLLPQIQKFNFV